MARAPTRKQSMSKKTHYAVWSFPTSAEAAAAFVPPPPHPLIQAVPRPAFMQGFDNGIGSD